MFAIVIFYSQNLFIPYSFSGFYGVKDLRVTETRLCYYISSGCRKKFQMINWENSLFWDDVTMKMLVNGIYTDFYLSMFLLSFFCQLGIYIQ